MFDWLLLTMTSGRCCLLLHGMLRRQGCLFTVCVRRRCLAHMASSALGCLTACCVARLQVLL
jgi:hypothetical protein